MPSLIETYHYLRPILELLYFVSGIVVAVAVLLGLRQITLTKQLASANARREALKFAAERCQYFAETVVPAGAKFFVEYNKLRLTFLTLQPRPKWKIKNGAIVDYNFDQKLLDAEFPKIEGPLVTYLNVLEAFAIPFTARVADDELGFKETAITFCLWVSGFMPAFYQMRRKNNVRFDSTIKLYEVWNRRTVAEAAVPAIKSLEAIVRVADSEKTNPLGTDD